MSGELSPTFRVRDPGAIMTEAIVGLAALTFTVIGGLTILSQTAFMPAPPLAIAVTKPEAETDALSGTVEYQETVVQAEVVESLYVAVAVREEVSPTVNASVDGLILTAITVGFAALTFTATGRLETLSQTAVTAEFPFATALTTPVPDTDAMRGVLDFHDVVVQVVVLESL